MNSNTRVELLEEELSRPTRGVIETLQRQTGDVIVLGASGKMGPTLARMVRRGLDQLDQPQRRVFAVARFSSPDVAEQLRAANIEVIACDLLDRSAVAALPHCPNVIYMAGQKFGTSEHPERTWAMNTIAPANVLDHFRGTRMVVFSTGCVYPLMPSLGRGASEDDPLTPHGEYANSCVARERVVSYLAEKFQTQVVQFRLCYAIEPRYGVLCDVAGQVARGEPVSLKMGWVNVIWQADANARAIQCLDHVRCPPLALNVTGLERLSVRWLAEQFGERLGRQPRFEGEESPLAWIWDASRSYELFGPPEMSLNAMIDRVAEWTRHNGPTLGKPTHFEATDGQY